VGELPLKGADLLGIGLLDTGDLSLLAVPPDLIEISKELVD
jgi:hypothetical protein